MAPNLSSDPDPSPLSAEKQQAFVRLLSQTQPALLRYVTSLVGNCSDAEDVVQRASLTMWQRFSTFEDGSDFLAWASTVSFYEARNFQRISGRAKLRFDDELLEILAAERAGQANRRNLHREALQECLARLPTARRELVDAIYVHGENVSTLAKRLGRAPQTLYNRLGAIRRDLAECVLRKLEAQGL